MKEKEIIHAKGIDISVYTADLKNEYISLTDIARYRSSEPRITIHNWLRGRDVVEFVGLWEFLHNPDFKRIEFDTFRKDAGSNAFTFSILRNFYYSSSFSALMPGKALPSRYSSMAPPPVLM